MEIFKKIRAVFCKDKGQQITADQYAGIIAKKTFEEQRKLIEENLRDNFATSAINAIIAGNNADISAMGLGAAKDAYMVADAMMEARKDKN